MSNTTSVTKDGAISKNAAIRLIKKFLPGAHNTIPIPLELVRLLGNYEEAAVFSQCMYWSERTDDPDGWFWKRYDEWEKDLAIGERTCRRRLNALESRGWIQTMVKKVRGVRALHVRVLEGNFIDSLTEAFLNPEPIATHGTGQNGRLAKQSICPVGETDKMAVSSITETTSRDYKTETTFHIDKHKPKSPDFLSGACFLEKEGLSHVSEEDGEVPILDGLSAPGSSQKEKSSVEKEKGAAPVFMPWKIGDDYEVEYFCGEPCLILPGTTRAHRPVAKSDFAMVKQAGAIALKAGKRFLLELGTSLVEVDEDSDDEGYTYCQRLHSDFEVDMDRAVDKNRVATMQHLLELALTEGLTTAPEFNQVLHDNFVDAIAWLRKKDEKKKVRKTRTTPADASQPF